MRPDSERFPPLTRSQRCGYAADPDVLLSDMSHLAEPAVVPPPSSGPPGSLALPVLLLALGTLPALLLLILAVIAVA
ncbi:hypothetical protein [Actinoplanes sp. NPDC023714]|uniref:hypothetical protein n=1 Tax=Actinoplanes sp. NPDC023714 TaxID=3154322 RepID=UPI0033D65863